MNEETLAVFIPIIAIFMSLLIPIVYAIVDYRRRRDVVEAHHKERMAAIERGMELPPLPEAFLVRGPRRRRSSYLLPGLVWTFAGIGLYFFMGAIASTDHATVALIPIGIGLALLIYHAVEGRKLPKDAPGETPAT